MAKRLAYLKLTIPASEMVGTNTSAAGSAELEIPHHRGELYYVRLTVPTYSNAASNTGDFSLSVIENGEERSLQEWDNQRNDVLAYPRTGQMRHFVDGGTLKISAAQAAKGTTEVIVALITDEP